MLIKIHMFTFASLHREEEPEVRRPEDDSAGPEPRLPRTEADLRPGPRANLERPEDGAESCCRQGGRGPKQRSPPFTKLGIELTPLTMMVLLSNSTLMYS